jgi:hypothetical protein
LEAGGLTFIWTVYVSSLQQTRVELPLEDMGLIQSQVRL